jgi:hypothetical protein
MPDSRGELRKWSEECSVFAESAMRAVPDFAGLENRKEKYDDE